MSSSNTILIVDDEPLGRETLELLLLYQGYRLAFAANGPEALSAAVALTPDLILLDVMMPDMDGFEVCRRLRAHPLLREVPILLLTALDDRDSRLMGIEAGADDFIVKPFDRTELRTRIKTILRLNRYRRLHAERARFEWAVEQAQEGYLILDTQDRIEYANPQAQIYLCGPLEREAAASPLLGMEFTQAAAQRFQFEPAGAWQAWRTVRISSTTPFYLVRPETTQSKPFWLQVEPMQTAMGETILRLQDVTDQLASARIMWSFQHQVTHKLRTPLGLLMGNLMLLREVRKSIIQTAEESETAELLDAVYHSAERLQHEVQSVLNLVDSMSASDRGADPFCLDTLCDLIQMLSTEVLSTPARLQMPPVDPAHLCLSISQAAMELVLRELFENGVKFHPQKSPTIDVFVAYEEGSVTICVQDDGLSLPPEQLQRMWMPYYQVEKTFTGQVPGMGLGLTMASSLVWEAGGECRSFNRPDRDGLVVEIKLPLAQPMA